MKYMICVILAWSAGIFTASGEPVYDPMPLFSKILENAANGGDPESLVKIDGLTKGTKSDPNHLQLAKDSMFLKPGKIPKYKRVTFWAKEREGKISQFHLAVHDRRDLFEKGQTLIEKTYGIKFEKTEWKKGQFGVSKKMEIVKGRSKILLKMFDEKIGDREMVSLTLKVEPVSEVEEGN